MAGEIVMPRLGWQSETATLVRWLKNDGDPVAAGEAVCQVESEKATHDVESFDSGILRIPPESPAIGVEVPVGTLLAHVVPAERGAPTEPAPQPAAPPLGSTPPVAPRLGRRPSRAGAAGAPDSPPELTRALLLGLYRQMVEIRRCEEQLARAHQMGLVHGACHTYVGEEAVATGVCAHLRPDDTITSTHRGHGHALAKGVSPVALMAELLGRVTGCSHGRGGSMHLFAPEVGLLGTSGIVGPSILLATGAAYTARLLGQEKVSVAFFGDGAANNGAFHEGLNLAAIWDLPVLFVCENNLYATEVPFDSVAGNSNVAERAVAYDIPGVRLDGNDILAVHEAAGEAVRRARAGAGPTLLECVTYRTRAHSEGMRDAGYRTQEEVEAWKQRCPIQRLRASLLGRELATADELDRVDLEVATMAEEALAEARNSPWPDPATATDHVYSR